MLATCSCNICTQAARLAGHVIRPPWCSADSGFGDTWAKLKEKRGKDVVKAVDEMKEIKKN